MTSIPEHAILYILLNKDIYGKYYKYLPIDYIKESYKELYEIFNSLVSAHAKVDGDLTLDTLHAVFVDDHPRLSVSDRALYDKVFEIVAAARPNVDTITSLLLQSKRKALLHNIALAAFEAAASGEVSESFKAAVEELQTTEINPLEIREQTTFVSDDLEEIYAQAVTKQGLRWRLRSLNQSLGSLRKGDMGFIFARPETGKTTFLCSEVAFMAGQTDQPVAWFNNEEQGNKVMLRLYQSALAFPLEKLLSDIKVSRKGFQEVTKRNIRIYDQALISRRDVESICKELSPSLIIFDQTDKITGFNADRNDLQLGAIYQWTRELAKTYAPVINVCQADGTGEGQKWLTMAHVANAKTSKQAEADWILGIGRTDNNGFEYVRHFNISKNKLFGDEDSIPSMRHGRWDVLIQPEIGRYKDIQN